MTPPTQSRFAHSLKILPMPTPLKKPWRPAFFKPVTAFLKRECRPGQILVYQVPIPEPLRFIEPRETETRKMRALQEYGVMQVKLYEDIARFGHIATAYAYPVES